MNEIKIKLIQLLWRVDSGLRSYSLSASDVRTYQQNCKCDCGKSGEEKSRTRVYFVYDDCSEFQLVELIFTKNTAELHPNCVQEQRCKKGIRISSKSIWQVQSLSSLQVYPHIDTIYIVFALGTLRTSRVTNPERVLTYNTT